MRNHSFIVSIKAQESEKSFFFVWHRNDRTSKLSNSHVDAASKKAKEEERRGIMREFLRGLELDEETIDTIMAEHGKIITKLKEQKF